MRIFTLYYRPFYNIWVSNACTGVQFLHPIAIGALFNRYTIVYIYIDLSFQNNNIKCQGHPIHELRPGGTSYHLLEGQTQTKRILM